MISDQYKLVTNEEILIMSEGIYKLYGSLIGRSVLIDPKINSGILSIWINVLFKMGDFF